MRLLTPPGLSGIAVVAFGDDERAAVTACLRTPSGRPLAAADPTRLRPRLATLRLGDAVIDEVLVVDRGASGFELHLHGSPAVVAALRERFGAQPAPPPVDAVDALLRGALAPEQLDLALEQRGYEFAAFVAELTALPVARRAPAVAAALERSRIARAHLEPHRLVLCGAQNAGKSTLFNRLLFRERALTGPLPGLTRDPVRELTTLAGYPYELVDTAGEGAVDSALDARAIAAGRELRRGSTLLLVVDGSCGPGAPDRELLASHPDVLVIANKADLPAAPWPAEIAQGWRGAGATADPAALREALGERLRLRRTLPPAGPVGGPAALAADQSAALAALAAVPFV